MSEPLESLTEPPDGSLSKGSRVAGELRANLRADLKSRYEAGASIRVLAEATGRSYGFIHTVLLETGVEIRRRGGANRRKL